MRKSAALLLTLLLAACGPRSEQVAAAAIGEFEPGLWQIDARAGSSGRPGVSGGSLDPAHYCLGGVMAAAPARMVVPHMLGMSVCGADGATIKDGKISGAFQCTAKGKPARLTGSYKRDSMMVTLDMPQGGGGPAGRLIMDIKHVGPCTGAPDR